MSNLITEKEEQTTYQESIEQSENGDQIENAGSSEETTVPVSQWSETLPLHLQWCADNNILVLPEIIVYRHNNPGLRQPDYWDYCIKNVANDPKYMCEYIREHPDDKWTISLTCAQLVMIEIVSEQGKQSLAAFEEEWGALNTFKFVVGQGIERYFFRIVHHAAHLDAKKIDRLEILPGVIASGQGCTITVSSKTISKMKSSGVITTIPYGLESIILEKAWANIDDKESVRAYRIAYRGERSDATLKARREARRLAVEDERFIPDLIQSDLLNAPPSGPPIFLRGPSQGEFGEMFGKSGSGKTYWVLETAIGLATGKPIIDAFAPGRKYRVAYMHMEDNTGRLKERYQFIGGLYEPSGTEIKDPDFGVRTLGSRVTTSDIEKVLNKSLFFVRAESELYAHRPQKDEDGNMYGEGIAETRWFLALERFIEERNIEVVIIDTLSQAAAMKQESDNSEMRVITNSMANLAERKNVVIILVHHSSQSGAEVVSQFSSRGATSLPGRCKWVCQLVADDADNKVQIHVLKRSYGSRVTAVNLERVEGGALQQIPWPENPDVEDVSVEDVLEWLMDWIRDHPDAPIPYTLHRNNANATEMINKLKSKFMIKDGRNALLAARDLGITSSTLTKKEVTGVDRHKMVALCLKVPEK